MTPAQLEKQGYKSLRVWNNAIVIVDDIYAIADSIPNYEKYRLVDQMVRAAISIPANIAEGSGRNSEKDFARFINYCKRISTRTGNTYHHSKKKKLYHKRMR